MLAAIKLATNPDVVLMAMDTVTREADCWTANDRWSRIVDVLMERLHLLKAGDKLHRPIVVLLSELEGRGRLSKAEKKELRHAKEKIQEVSLFIIGSADDSSLSKPRISRRMQVSVCRL
jgi:hypothetical protein